MAGAAALLMTIPSASAIDRALPSISPRYQVSADEAPSPASASTVTLLTGDRVTIAGGRAGNRSVSVQGPDGHRADVRITTLHGDTYVYPFAADPYVTAGVLDTELFNVTGLVADGYDDAHSAGLPVILSYSSASRRKDAASDLPQGATDVRPLTSIASTAVTQDRTRARDFWSDLVSPPASRESKKTDTSAHSLANGLTKVWLDGKVTADLAESVSQIGAPEVWADGDDGQGVDVAVLDTGYDSGHPDLKDVVDDSRSFVPGEDTEDHHGHGTHVASTIAGSGAASDGKEKGVAPGVRLHVGKVLDNSGSGANSWIISGMEWAARDAHARVISLSLGGSQPSDGSDPMSRAVNELSAETGALFTIAAGNSGPDASTVSAPGAADAALTVGAVDSKDAVAEFSSRGPRFRDDAPKPEITAPGVAILAARSQYAIFGTGSYATLSGTSMATPHVAGVAALVAARHPEWSGSAIKDALISTSKATPGNDSDAGGDGRVDAAAAVRAAVVATGVSDAGIHSLGGTPGETVTRRVTWTNPGSAAVTVTIGLDAPDAPDGLFVVADRQLSVPAYGTAATTVTTVLDHAAKSSRYTGYLTGAVAARTVTRTLLSLSTHEEYHHLRAHVRDREGAPVVGLVMYQREGDAATHAEYTDDDGTLDTVVEPGTYTVWTWSAVRGLHGASSFGRALLVRTGVEVTTSDTDIALDGTELRQTQVVTPKPTTDSFIRMDFTQSFKDGSPAIGESVTVGDAFDSIWALPGHEAAGSSFTYTARWRMQQPLLTLSSGTQVFDDLWLLQGSGRPAEGIRTLPAVFAGDGTSAEYSAARARGKAAVVRYVPDTGGDDDEEDFTASEDQFTAAQRAGVALLIVVNDEDGRLHQPVHATDLVIAGISLTEGEALISRIRSSRTESVPVRAVGHAQSSYLYDLVHAWHGMIPRSQRYAPGASELSRVDVTFHQTPGSDVEEFRQDLQPYLDMAIGVRESITSGTERTDWVTPAGEATWTEEALGKSARYYGLQLSGAVSYTAGRTTDVEWFGPIWHPRMNVRLDLPVRRGGSIEVTVPAWGDGGPDHSSTTGPGSSSQVNRLYDGAKLLASADGGLVTADVHDGLGHYRLVTSTQQEGEYPYSTATRTEWGFSSAGSRSTDAKTLPLVQLDYGITTDAHGTAERDAELRVTASSLPGTSAGTVRTSSIEASYDDGRTWHHLSLHDAGAGTTRAHLDAPRGARFLSLRVHASDAHGDTIAQTLTRAAGLG